MTKAEKGKGLRALAVEWLECQPIASRLVKGVSRVMDSDKVEGCLTEVHAQPGWCWRVGWKERSDGQSVSGDVYNRDFRAGTDMKTQGLEKEHVTGWRKRSLVLMRPKAWQASTLPASSSWVLTNDRGADGEGDGEMNAHLISE